MNLSTDQLRRLLTIREQKDKLEKEEAAILGGKSAKPKSKLSKAARLKISKQVKARWAARKAKGQTRL